MDIPTTYRWFSWGVASHQEGKSRDVCSLQLCAKYRQGSATLSPYHQCQKIKELVSERFAVQLPLIMCLPSWSRTVNWHFLETIYTRSIYSARWFTWGAAKGKLSGRVYCVYTLSIGSIPNLHFIERINFAACNIMQSLRKLLSFTHLHERTSIYPMTKWCYVVYIPVTLVNISWL